MISEDMKKALIDAERKELRDQFAAQEQLADCHQEGSGLSLKALEALAGRKAPEFAKEPLAFFEWEAAWRARLKYIRADAMLHARQERPQ